MMSGLKNDYVNWLSIVEQIGGEFAWIRQEKKFYSSNTPHNTTEKLCATVLASPAVINAIQLESQHRKCHKNLIANEARQIVMEMAHNFQLSMVKPFGYAILKVIKQIYDGIYVNMHRLEKIKEMHEKDVPIVFMPTHKSYMDFLLISLLCYHCQISLPAICAGEDFRASTILGESLRRCGAFFIRRTFNKNILYWAIFTEYVQIHLNHNIRPVEFFVEGQRSRTLKSIHPKNGFFRIVLEPFFASDVFDIILAPVTINYDKVLEESLYGFELLGFPKPKETASGLFKARQILQKKFGNIYVTFGETISIREYFATVTSSNLLRAELALMPRIKLSLQGETRNKIRILSHLIIKIHNQHNILTIWPLICFIFLKSHFKITHSELLDRVCKLKCLIEKMNFSVTLLNSSVELDIRYYLKLQSNLLKIDDTNNQILLNTDNTKNSIEMLVNQLAIFNYCNVLFTTIVNPALFALTTTKQLLKNVSSLKTSTLIDNFRFLKKIFEREFICIPNQCDNDFYNALKLFQKMNALKITNNNEWITIIKSEFFMSIGEIFEPWVHSYAMIFRAFHHMAINTKSSNISNSINPRNKLIDLCRTNITLILKTSKLLSLKDDDNNFKIADDENPFVITNLSTDTIRNALERLIDSHIIRLHNGNVLRSTTNEQTIEFDMMKLQAFISKVENFKLKYAHSNNNITISKL